MMNIYMEDIDFNWLKTHAITCIHNWWNIIYYTNKVNKGGNQIYIRVVFRRREFNEQHQNFYLVLRLNNWMEKVHYSVSISLKQLKS